MVIRAATLDDAATLATLIEGFAQNHPVAAHPRSTEAMSEAYLGHDPLSGVLLARTKRRSYRIRKLSAG